MCVFKVESYRKPLKESEYQRFRKKVRKNLLLCSFIVKSQASVRYEILYGMAAICEIAVLLLAGCVKKQVLQQAGT